MSFWPLVRPRRSFTMLCYLGDFIFNYNLDFGYEQTQGNTQERFKMWLVYHLGVSDKVY